MDPTRTTAPQIDSQMNPTGTRCTRAGAIRTEDASTPSDEMRARRARGHAFDVGGWS
jgi:hypothetical protein